MKPHIIGLLLLIGINNMHAQNKVHYGYDASGNRISRTVVLSKSMANAVRNKQNGYSDAEDCYNVKIYPNHTDSRVRVTVSDKTGGKVSGLIAVYSTGGAIVTKQKIMEFGNDIDLSGKQNGIYILHITVGNSVSTWKIIKE